MYQTRRIEILGNKKEKKNCQEDFSVPAHPRKLKQSKKNNKKTDKYLELAR